MAGARKKLAFVVSHPIQYYAPLYQRLARNGEFEIKVFFTWHAGSAAVEDRGFKQPVVWDIPLTEGYDHEVVPNVSSNPGTDRFLGLQNPSLVERVIGWKPDVVHVTGWAWLSHLLALRTFHRLGIRTLFRGDSHLLDSAMTGPRWWAKRALLRQVFSWPTAFLVVGAANRAYYQAFGVEPDRLFPCTHSIDVRRFAEPADVYEREASEWRRELGIAPAQRVVLFAGKFEDKKQPIALMQAIKAMSDPRFVAVFVGNGELDPQIKALAVTDARLFRVLPFQNQSRMPVVYRLADLFVLPSKQGETWGLAVNEALACARPVLVSDRVGCAVDVVDPVSGRIFPWNDLQALQRSIRDMLEDTSMPDARRAAADRSLMFDISRTEAALAAAVRAVCHA